LVQGSARHLPFAAGTFDTLCSIFLLHHLAAVNARRSRAAIIAALAECRRVLRPTGKLLVAETWPFRLMHLYHALYPMLYPTARRAFGVELPHFFAPSALEEMARSAGFREVAVAPVRIFEPIRQPVLGITLPAWLQRLLHSFAVYTIRP
jgi:ubiquinone/menaquinone biosynthesis C-methylase UbiE